MIIGHSRVFYLSIWICVSIVDFVYLCLLPDFPNWEFKLVWWILLDPWSCDPILELRFQFHCYLRTLNFGLVILVSFCMPPIFGLGFGNVFLDYGNVLYSMFPFMLCSYFMEIGIRVESTLLDLNRLSEFMLLGDCYLIGIHVEFILPNIGLLSDLVILGILFFLIQPFFFMTFV